MFQNMMKCKGVWARMRLAPFSQLAQPGYVVRNKATKKTLLVIHSSQFGLAGVNLTAEVLPSKKVTINLVSGTTELMADVSIEDPDVWAASMPAVVGGEEAQRLTGSAKLTLMFGEETKPLYQFAASRGFKGAILRH